MVEVKPINISLNQHSPGLSVRTAISPTLTEEFIIHPSVYSEIKKLGHAKSDVLLSESGSSLGVQFNSNVSFSNVSVSNVIENSSYDLPHVKNFNTRNDLSSLIKDYKCNKIKSTKLKLSIIREKCSDIVLCKKVNGAMKTSSVNFNTPSPMESKHRRFTMLRKIFQPWQWKRRKKRNRFEQTSRTLQRKISMRSTKDQLDKKDVLMPVKHNVFLFSFGLDEKGIKEEVPLRTAYSQDSRIDEAHFWLNGYVSKQNCRIWSEANPQVYVETPLHPEKLTVWCALWSGGIIGPYFFKNDEGHNVTVNGDRYRAMITNFFIPELNNHDVQELWFQQDGTTCHTARATIDLLKDTFGDRLISRFGPVNWPPRSCDLTPLDYFLWGYVKSLVCADKPQTPDHLEDNIRRVIADIRPQMLEKVMENWTSRLDYIRASRGSPMPEIIFKM
ncbi:transposase [Trichonephila clavipes]|nr:transposase [Trichonephila clavipes]